MHISALYKYIYIFQHIIVFDLIVYFSYFSYIEKYSNFQAQLYVKNTNLQHIYIYICVSTKF